MENDAYFQELQDRLEQCRKEKRKERDLLVNPSSIMDPEDECTRMRIQYLAGEIDGLQQALAMYVKYHEGGE